MNDRQHSLKNSLKNPFDSLIERHGIHEATGSPVSWEGTTRNINRAPDWIHDGAKEVISGLKTPSRRNQEEVFFLSESLVSGLDRTTSEVQFHDGITHGKTEFDIDGGVGKKVVKLLGLGRFFREAQEYADGMGRRGEPGFRFGHGNHLGVQVFLPNPEPIRGPHIRLGKPGTIRLAMWWPSWRSPKLRVKDPGFTFELASSPPSVQAGATVILPRR